MKHVFRTISKAATVGVILFVVFAGVTARAQQYLATLTGEVSDSLGAKIPNAAVTATEASTNFVAKGVTNESGTYTIAFLQPGTYTVTVTAPEFSPAKKTDVILHASDKTQVDFGLVPGAASEIVTVSADKEYLDTGSANLGDVLDAKQVSSCRMSGGIRLSLPPSRPVFIPEPLIRPRQANLHNPIVGLPYNCHPMVSVGTTN